MTACWALFGPGLWCHVVLKCEIKWQWSLWHVVLGVGMRQNAVPWSRAMARLHDGMEGCYWYANVWQVGNIHPCFTI